MKFSNNKVNSINNSKDFWINQSLSILCFDTKKHEDKIENKSEIISEKIKNVNKVSFQNCVSSPKGILYEDKYLLITTKRFIKGCKGRIQLIIGNKSNEKNIKIKLILSKNPLKSNLSIELCEYLKEIKALSENPIEIYFEIMGWFSDNISIDLKV